jgi:hypothetical protein
MGVCSFTCVEEKEKKIFFGLALVFVQTDCLCMHHCISRFLSRRAAQRQGSLAVTAASGAIAGAEDGGRLRRAQLALQAADAILYI